MVYKWQKILAAFFITLGIGIVIWAMVGQTRQLTQPQDTRSQAEETPVVEVSWSDISQRVEKGKSTSLDLKINSKNWQFSGLELWGTITGIPQSEVKFETISIPGLVTITQQFKTEGDKVLFHLVYFSDINVIPLFSTNNGTISIGRLVFTPTQNRSLEVTLDTVKSDVASYTTPTLILSYLNSGKKTSSLELYQPGQGGPVDDGKKECNLNCATDTECKSQFICFQGRCRNPNVKEDDKCGSKPDLGLQRQCNQYCADTRECAAGFSCYYNFCRNPKNLESTECKLPASPTPRPVTTTGTGGVKASPKVTAQVTIESKPLAAATISTKTATSTAKLTSPSPRSSASPIMAPQPSIVPVPDDVQPEAPTSSIWSTIWKIGLVILILLVIGAVVWWWRQNRTPTRSSDY